MKVIVWMLACVLYALNCRAQESDAEKAMQHSFVAFSDSILIREDADNELAVVYELAKNKRIVAIGEVTHGTKEVLAFQRLVAVNLVKRYGFNCIVFGEISMLDSYRINEFVVNQRGNAGELIIKGKAKVREVAYRQMDMIDFYCRIRDFNKGRPFKDRVWVVGADIDEPKEIINFVMAHCLEYKIDSAITLLKKLNIYSNRVHQSNKISIHTIIESSNRLVDMLEKNRHGVDSTDFKIDMMVHLLKTLPQLVAFSSDTDLKYKMRDKFIFENINWLIESCRREKLVIIKAHNFHVNKRTIYTEVFGKFLTFGEYLSKQYQQAYLSIGTEVQQGRFYTGASTPSKIAGHKNKIGAIIGANTKAQYGILFCDSSAKVFLNKTSHTITYGTINYRSSLLINGKGLLGEAFDAMIFIKNSTPYRFGKGFRD